MPRGINMGGREYFFQLGEIAHDDNPIFNDARRSFYLTMEKVKTLDLLSFATPETIWYVEIKLSLDK